MRQNSSLMSSCKVDHCGRGARPASQGRECRRHGMGAVCGLLFSPGKDKAAYASFQIRDDWLPPSRHAALENSELPPRSRLAVPTGLLVELRAAHVTPSAAKFCHRRGRCRFLPYCFALRWFWGDWKIVLSLCHNFKTRSHTRSTLYSWAEPFMANSRWSLFAYILWDFYIYVQNEVVYSWHVLSVLRAPEMSSVISYVYWLS